MRDNNIIMFSVRNKKIIIELTSICPLICSSGGRDLVKVGFFFFFEDNSKINFLLTKKDLCCDPSLEPLSKTVLNEGSKHHNMF